MLDVLFDVMIPVFAAAAIGGVVGRRIGLSNETMSRAVFFLFSPALVFSSMSTADLHGRAVGRLALVAVGVFLANAALGGVWSALRSSPPSTRAVTTVAGALPNQGNLALPVALLAFGQRGLDVAVLIFVMATVISATLGIAVATYAAGSHTLRGALAAPLRFPSIYAAVAGVIVNLGGITTPAAIHEPFELLGQAAVPCMLLVLGLSFRMPERDGLLEPVAASINRLVLGPVCALGITSVVGLHGLRRDVAIMMAAMPTAVATLILAQQVRGDAALAVRCVIVSTIMSIATLTVVISLVR